jgi:hypothetical protein
MASFGTVSAPPFGAPSRALNLPIFDQGMSTHNHAVALMGPPVPAIPSGNPRGGPSFAKLNLDDLDDADDIGDFDDGRIVQVCSELGKRDRLDSPGKGEQNEPGRPTRRLVCSYHIVSRLRLVLKCNFDSREGPPVNPASARRPLGPRR